MRWRILLGAVLALALLSPPALAYNCPAGPSCTAAVTDNAGTVALQIPSGSGTVVIQITGTFSGTLEFEQSADGGATYVAASGTPQPSGSAATNTTTTGTWRFVASGMTNFRVRASAFASGQARITIQASSGSAASGASGGSSIPNPLDLIAGGSITSADTGNPTITFGSNSVNLSGDSAANGCTIDNNGNLTCPGQVLSGGGGTGVGCMDFYDSGGINYSGFCAPNTVATTYEWSMPTSDAAGVVTSDGAGNLYLSAPSPNMGTGLVSGGGVFCSTTALTCSVAPAVYTIAGQQYTSTLQTVTFDAADPSDPRYDVIELDNTGTAGVVKGTAATNPVKPSADPTTGLELTFVTIGASATAPTVSSETIYLEDAGSPAEWNCTSSTARIVVNSTNNPYAGTYDIEATGAAAGDYVSCVIGTGTVSLSTFNNLTEYLRSKAAWPKNKAIVTSFYLSATPVGSPVTLGNGSFTFNSSQTSSYQQMTVAASAWAATTPVDTVKFTVTGGGGSIGFYLDNIILQSGTSPPPSGAGVTKLIATSPIAVDQQTGTVTVSCPTCGNRERKCHDDRITRQRQPDRIQRRIEHHQRRSFRRRDDQRNAGHNSCETLGIPLSGDRAHGQPMPGGRRHGGESYRHYLWWGRSELPGAYLAKRFVGNNQLLCGGLADRQRE